MRTDASAARGARDRLASAIIDSFTSHTGGQWQTLAEHIADCLIADGYADASSVDGRDDPHPELLPEHEWRRREVMFLARQVVEHRNSALAATKLDQLAAAIEQLDELRGYRPAGDPS